MGNGISYNGVELLSLNPNVISWHDSFEILKAINAAYVLGYEKDRVKYEVC